MSPLGNRVRVFPRGGGRWNFRTFVDQERNERIAVINSGVQVVVDGIDELGTVSLETDRIVFWLPNSSLTDANIAQNLQAGDGPLEFYLEGNIVFRQGDRVIYADRMYYNVRQENGVVLNAEMLTPVPEYQGLLRLKAEVLQQVNRQRFEAYGAALTSSRIGVPRYWFQTQSVAVDDIQTPLTILHEPAVGRSCHGRSPGPAPVMATCAITPLLLEHLLLAGDRHGPDQADLLPRQHQVQERPGLWDASAARLGPAPIAGHRESACRDAVDSFDRLS
jgi:hypothetical protein